MQQPISKSGLDIILHNDDHLWNHHFKNDPALGFILDILNTNKLSMSFHEAANLHRLVSEVNHLDGEIAELGVLYGNSAKIICNANRSRRAVHLFDTFTGIPEQTKEVDALPDEFIDWVPPGYSLDGIKANLADYADLVQFHVGMFPTTAAELPADIKFQFVNLDMDTYVSTKLALEYFYPRMLRGAIIVGHDFAATHCAGVSKAFREFFEDKPEPLIELWFSQVAVVKI